MFISPDNFIEIYKTSELPLFYIRKGESTAGRIMKKFVKKFDKTNAGERQERTEEGLGLLDEFFGSYEFGEVNIELLASPQDGKESRLYHHVSWGEKPQRYGRSNSAQNSKGPSENWMMMQFMLNQQNQQQQLMMAMLKENSSREREFEKRNYKLMLDKYKIETELEAAEGSSPQEALMMESIGLVKPVAAAIVARFNPMLATSIMGSMDGQTVNGMQKTLPENTAGNSMTDPNTGNTATSAEAGTTKHCMANFSHDLILKCVQYMMVNVFPEYNVNGVMPVLAQMLVAQSAMLKPLIVAEIEKNRQQAQASAGPEKATNGEGA